MSASARGPWRAPAGGTGAEAGAPAPDAAALESLAARALERAKHAGARDAEVCVQHGRAFSVKVQNGSIETLKQSATHGLGLRVIVDDRIGFVSTTDFRGGALDDLARRAVALARFSTPDPANAFPTLDDAADGDGTPPDLELFDPDVLALAPERKIAMALELERLALAPDPRLKRSQGASVSSSDGLTVLANSHGLVRTETGTGVSVYVMPLADDRDGKQQTGYDAFSACRMEDLPSIEEVAARASERALARVGARPVPSAKVPVVMHPDVAAGWIASMFGAFSGEAIIKQESWLTGKLGTRIASEAFTLVDDGRLPRRTGSSMWDGEGIPTRRNVLVDRGACATYLYDLYHARRANTRSTGSASRSYGSTPGIGAHNLHLEPGTETPEAILARVDRGFYLDGTGSFGFNPVTGDYSYQAEGFWIEKGAKAFPVDGVTVASTSLVMLKNVVAIGNDVRWDGSIVAPTLLIAEMTLSGSAG